MGEITASDDVTKSAVLYTRMAKVGKGVLTAHEKLISPAVKESIQQDVARDALNAMQRYMEGGAYQNLTSCWMGGMHAWGGLSSRSSRTCSLPLVQLFIMTSTMRVNSVFTKLVIWSKDWAV